MSFTHADFSHTIIMWGQSPSQLSQIAWNGYDAVQKFYS